MDSVTHIVVGAAIGDRLFGKKIGRWALLVGAIAKSLPDFDLFYSGLSDPKRYILYHRSYTHSFFIELLTAFPLAYVFFLLFKKKVSYAQWLGLCIICLWAHSLMDVCTNYGTRLFLPFSNQVFSLNNIAILDLILTLPILLALIAGVFFKNESKARIRTMQGILIYTTLYFGYTFVNKVVINRTFKDSIQQTQPGVSRYMTNPSILNNFLWYGVANKDSQLIIGEYSLFQKDKHIDWYSYPTKKYLLSNCPSPDARMLEWFSQGYYFCNQNNDTLEVFTVKFGRGDMSVTEAHKTFIMYYQIYRENGEWKFKAQQPNDKDIQWGEAFNQLWRRIKGENVSAVK